MKRNSRERSGRPVRIDGRTPRGLTASPILRDCKGCLAQAGHRCQAWKTESGERMYVVGPKKKFCAERRSA